jgi:hypothetical protein
MKMGHLQIAERDGYWLVVDEAGRTLDACRSRNEAEESRHILQQWPEYGGRLP